MIYNNGNLWMEWGQKKKGVETSEGKIMKKRGDYAFTFH